MATLLSLFSRCLSLVERKGLWIFVFLITAMVVAFSGFFPSLIRDFMLFLPIWILCVGLPSFYFGRKFFSFSDSQKSGTSFFEHLVFGYSATTLLMFVLLWIGNYFHVQKIVYLIFVFSFLGIYQLIRDHRTRAHDSRIEPTSARLKEQPLTWTFLLFLCLLFLVYFFLNVVLLFQQQEPPLEPGTSALFYPDLLWNAGNIWSIIRGTFPTIDVRFEGQILGYHLIQSYSHAYLHLLTGIQPFLLQVFFHPIVDGFVLIYSIGIGAKRLLALKDSSIVFLLLTFLFTKGIGWYYHGHLYANPLTFFFSLSPFFLFLMAIKRQLEQWDLRGFAFLLVTYMHMMGSKGSLALVTLPSLALLCLWNLIRKRDLQKFRNELLLGLGFIIASLALKGMIFLESRPMGLNPGVENSHVFQILLAKLGFLPLTLIRILFSTYLTLKTFPIVWLSFSGFFILSSLVVWKSLREKLFQQSRFALFLVLFVLMGCVCDSFIFFEGSDAGIYFTWYSYIVLVIFAGLVFEHLTEFPSKDLAWGKGRAVLALSMVHWVLGFGSFALGQWEGYRGRMTTSTNIPSALMDQAVTANEYSALQWIRTNIEDGALIASHRRSFSGGPTKNFRVLYRFFAYSALSGKQFIAEGDEFNVGQQKENSDKTWEHIEKFLWSLEPGDKEEALRQTKADYFIQSLRFDRQNLSQLPFLKLVYENPDIKIFRIAKDVK